MLGLFADRQSCSRAARTAEAYLRCRSSEPVAESELFEECAYLIGVSENGGSGSPRGYVFGSTGRPRRPALALDIGGFGPASYEFLAVPAEEPPSLECNEDAGEEENGD